jgi:hypothetical protein
MQFRWRVVFKVAMLAAMVILVSQQVSSGYMEPNYDHHL